MDRLMGLVGRRPILILSSPVVLALAAEAFARTNSEWVRVFVATARELLAGHDIYSAGHAYLYPPFAALLAIPFAALPDWAARVGWFLVNIAATIWLFRSAWGLAGGPPVVRAPSSDRGEWLALGLGVMGSAPYVLNAFAHQQADVVIAALLTAGCGAMLRGRPAVGAALIGLSAAFKGPPLLFAGYLLFRRRWWSAVLVVGVAVGVNLLPDLIAHPAHGTWLGNWLSRVALPAANPATPLGTWNTTLFNLYNQSLGGTLQRLATSTPVLGASGADFAAKAAPVGVGAMKAIAYSLMLLMLAVSAWAGVSGQTSIAPAGSPADLPSRTAVEFGMMMILILLISPMSDLAHLAVLATPLLCLSRVAVRARRRVAFAAVVFAVICALAANKDLVGGTVYDLVLWAGAPMAGAVALWLGGVFVLMTGCCAPAAPAFSGSIVDWLANPHRRSAPAS